MNIAIVGAGALGVYFGGRLEESGHKVTFLVREKRAEQIKQFGLKIHSVRGDYSFSNVNFTTDAANIKQADLVLLSVKGYHLQGALPTLEKLTRKGAKVLPLLNGVEHYQILQKALGEETILGGLAFIIATLDEKGRVYHTSKQHKLVFGPLQEEQASYCEELYEAFRKANFEVEKSDKIETAIWNKYMFITAFSGLTTAANLPIGTIRKHPETLEIGIKMLREMKELANLYNVPLTEKHIENGILSMKQLPEDGTSSMHQDKKKGLPLELDHLQGAALRLASQKKASLPTIETIYQLLKPYERGLNQ